MLAAECRFTKNKNTCITNFPSIGTTKANPVINKPQITAGKEKKTLYTTCRFMLKVNRNPQTVFPKSCILDVCLGFEYDSDPWANFTFSQNIQ